MIIDACVAGACTSVLLDRVPAKILFGRECRDILDAVRSRELRVIMSKSLADEWTSHASSYARRWKVEMIGARLLRIVPDSNADAVMTAIDASDFSERERAAAEKDAHMVATALSHGVPIISGDSKARDLFKRLCPDACVAPVIWVDARENIGQASSWVRTGAQTHNHLRLCA